MGRLTDIDSPVMTLLGKMTNLVTLNICFMIGALPIVTIGASLTALHSVTLKMVDNEESYIFRSFWKAYRENFKTATACWLIMAAVGGVFGFNFYVLMGLQETYAQGLLGVMFVLFAIYLGLLVYLFAYIATFVDGVGTCMKNSFIILITNHIFSVVLAALTATAVLVTFYNIEVFLRLLFIWVVIGFALISYIQDIFLKRIFAKYYN